MGPDLILQGEKKGHQLLRWSLTVHTLLPQDLCTCCSTAGISFPLESIMSCPPTSSFSSSSKGCLLPSLTFEHRTSPAPTLAAFPTFSLAAQLSGSCSSLNILLVDFTTACHHPLFPRAGVQSVQFCLPSARKGSSPQ